MSQVIEIPVFSRGISRHGGLASVQIGGGGHNYHILPYISAGLLYLIEQIITKQNYTTGFILAKYPLLFLIVGFPFVA